MAKKLYVGNISFNVTQAQIHNLFSQVGEVAEVNLITDRATGASRGFGFVEMVTEEAALEAINRFNGYSLDERSLTVNEARPREERSGSGFGGGSGGGRRDSGRRNRF